MILAAFILLSIIVIAAFVLEAHDRRLEKEHEQWLQTYLRNRR